MKWYKIYSMKMYIVGLFMKTAVPAIFPPQLPQSVGVDMPRKVVGAFRYPLTMINLGANLRLASWRHVLHLSGIYVSPSQGNSMSLMSSPMG